MNRDSLFQSTLVPGKPGSGRLFDEELTVQAGPVTCLGMTFTNDAERRSYFTEKLREKLKDSEFRKIEGFPIGSDEDILALSDPPYYTACPNPWLADFIKEWEAAKSAKPEGWHYHREPFATDVSEGKNDPIYNAHSYHTKVPHKAIMRYVEHYTEAGDIILDGFCGTGMTAVAAALCGQRKTIIADLSPIATFIASNLLRSIDRDAFLRSVEYVCQKVRREFGYLYETSHSGWAVRDRKIVAHKSYERPGETPGVVEFTLFSDVVRCPECSHETTLYEVLVDEKNDAFYSEIKCTQCKAVVPEAKWEPVRTTQYDPLLGEASERTKIEPVLINYSVGSTRYEKIPDDQDRRLLDRALELIAEQHRFPVVRLIDGKETQRNAPIGVTHLHHFFTDREHLFAALVLEEIEKHEDHNTRLALLFALTASLPYASRMRRFRADRKGGGPLSGTLYISSLITPPNVLKTFQRNAHTIADSLTPPVDPNKAHAISTQDAACLKEIPDSSIDYIFTDPPFGHNFDYSELNFFWEGILGVRTNQKTEAIVSSAQRKDVGHYRNLMRNVFSEYHRVLKPGRWMTVEFSNTKASVWNSIQTAITESGFIIANVSALDKKQGSFKAVMTPTAVKQDLVISAYKPNGGFGERFRKEAQSEDGVWDFVHTHLKYLPRVKIHGGELQFIPERDPRILFDQVVAYYLRQDYPVPISSQEFQSGLAQRFIERDGMYFLSEQAAEYDRAKMQYGNPGEHLDTSVVDDEQSAIVWLRARLRKAPQVYSDIQPAFMPMLSHLKPNERELLSLELLLNQNFLCYDGNGPVPEQIHAYLSSNWKELRNLAKDDPALRAKARDRWYVPDPNKAGDLEKLREKALLKEFDAYKQEKKKLKVFRLEAVRAGFKKAWADRDYATIVAVADKIPANVLEEDPKLLMWYDQAATRMGGDT